MAAVEPDGFPGYVAAAELVESAWGNAVVDHLPKFLGYVAAINAGNVVADGTEKSIGSGLSSVTARVDGQVLVLWTFHYANSAAPGRINPIMRAAGNVIGSANQSFAAADFGTISIVGGFGVAAGASCALAFSVAITGASANQNVSGDAVAFLFGT